MDPAQVTTEQSSPNKTPFTIRSPRGDLYTDDDGKNDHFTTEKSRKIWNEILVVKEQMSGEIENLESSLSKVLQQHELEYMQAYNIYVKNKESDLKKLIDEITNKLGDKVANDNKMKRLELNAHILKDNAVNQGKEIVKLYKDIKTANSRLEAEKQEKMFYHCIALENKKQKKLLKVSLARVTQEYDILKQKLQTTENSLAYTKSLTMQFDMVRSSTQVVGDIKRKDESLDDDNTFMTSTSQHTNALPQLKHQLNAKDIMNNQSLLSISDRSSLNLKPLHPLNKTTIDQMQASRRVNSVFHFGSRYRQGQIPTENLKFEQLCKIVFGSLMNKEEIKAEIINFVRDLETNYNERIVQLQRLNDKEKKATQQERIRNVSKVQDKTDLEQLFVNCVEDVRKDVIKRRLKSEITNVRGKTSSASLETQKDFDITLDKLADMAKGRVKIEEFTLNDRINLLDLFVNNEKTLVAVQESLFPKPAKTVRNSDMGTINSENFMAPNTNMLETSSAYDSRPEFTDINIKQMPGNGRNNKAAFTMMDKSLGSIKSPKNQNPMLQRTELKQKKVPHNQTPQGVARSDANLQHTNMQPYFELQPSLAILGEKTAQ